MDSLSILNTLLKDTNDYPYELKADTSFEEMDMDEFDIVDFLMRVEEYYDIAFDSVKMLEVKTIGDVMNMISESNQEDI